MRRIVTIAVVVFAFFFVEIIFFNIFDRWFKPNLLLIFVVFINLYLGIRYSIITAVFAGLIKDCFSANLFGVSIFSFIVCAYLTTYIRRYHYQVGSSYSRFMAVFFVTIADVVIHYIINVMYASVDFEQALSYVFIPEVLSTILVAPFLFKRMKIVATKIGL